MKRLVPRLAALALGVGLASFASVGRAQTEPAQHSFYIVPKLGLLLDGGGDTTSSCSGALCPTRPSLSLDDKSDPVLGVDFLASITKNVRLGGGLLYVTGSKYATGGFTQSVGTDLSLVGIVEGVFPVSSTVSLAARGQLGAIVLFPGGALKDRQNADRAACGNVCTVSEGPFGAFTWGIGGGGIFDVGPLGLRADILYQGISSLTFNSVTGAVEGSEKYTGHRFWFLVGGDIGL
jgi:hypothetical protein